MSQFRRNSEFQSSTMHKKAETSKMSNSSRVKPQLKSKAAANRSRNPFYKDSNVSQSVKTKENLNLTSSNANLISKENNKNNKSYNFSKSNKNNKSNVLSNRRQKSFDIDQILDAKNQTDPFDFLTFLTKGINSHIAKEKLMGDRKNNNLKQTKKTLICSNVISIQHYYQDEDKENAPLPFKGILVSKINNTPMVHFKIPKNNENYDSNSPENKSYSKNFTNLTLNLSTEVQDAKSKVDEKKEDIENSSKDCVDQQEEELQFVIPLMVSANTTPRMPKPTKQEKLSLNKSEELVSDLFADDGVPISFFDFDFATSYVINNCEVIQEKNPQNYFPLFSQLDSQKKADLTNDDDVSNLVKTLFRSITQTKLTDDKAKNNNEIINFTSLLPPETDGADLDIKANKIVAISPSSFFDFRFGEQASDFSSDRLHIYTWHNLGIPASQIAKNLIMYITSPNDHLDIQIELKGIIQYILIWIKYFPKDFEDKSNRCADVIMQLMKKLVNKLKVPNTNINIIRAIVEGIAEGTINSEDFQPQILTPVFKTLDVNKGNKLIQLTIDPCVLSAHLTYIDLQLIHKLQRNEFVHSIWRNRPEASQNFQNLMKRFNETVEFIITSILVDSEKRRARNISYWIKIMYHSKKTRNFHLLAAIDSALSSLPILRLTGSWKLVNENALLAFKRLHNFFTLTKNQEEMFTKPSNTIPFIGVFISQLDQLEDEDYKTTLKTGEMGYNLVLQRKALSIIEEIFLPWGVSLPFELDDDILNSCRSLDGKMTNPNDMLELSLKYESMRYSEKTLLDDLYYSKE